MICSCGPFETCPTCTPPPDPVAALAEALTAAATSVGVKRDDDGALVIGSTAWAPVMHAALTDAGWSLSHDSDYVESDLTEAELCGIMLDMDSVLEEVRTELRVATSKFGSFASAHEGWAVIREEVDELWEDVKANKGYDACARKEAIQVAAMAIRYVMDISDGKQVEVSTLREVVHPE